MAQWRKTIQTGRTDKNQREIVKALRQIHGVSVETGHDDIICGYMGRSYWFEIKDPDKALSKRTGVLLDSALKPSQIKLRDTWTGHYSIIWKLEQILEEIGVTNERTGE